VTSFILSRLLQVCHELKKINYDMARHPLLINEFDYQSKGIKLNVDI
jgi:hypothetical protein